jgi:hypothetical protein
LLFFGGQIQNIWEEIKVVISARCLSARLSAAENQNTLVADPRKQLRCVCWLLLHAFWCSKG